MSIDARELRYRYPTQDIDALDGITATIRPGEVTWITGRLGSGASTFLLAASGLAPRLIGGTRSGQLAVLGADPARQAPIASSIGYLSASPSLQLSGVVSTVADEVAVGPMNLGLPPQDIARRTAAALERFDVAHLRLRDPSMLSGGETQRVMLAALHAASPAVWLLDEPFSALDHASRLALNATLRAIARDGAIVVIASDDADTLIGSADRVLVMDRGKLVLDGVPAEILAGDGIGATGAASTDAADLAAHAGIPAPRPLSTGDLLSRLPSLESAAIPRAVAPATSSAGADSVLHVRAASFRYSDGPDVLREASMTVEGGDAVGIFGANGAGKSTLLRLAMALEQPTSGSVEVLGRSTRGLHPEDFAFTVGFLFQQPERQLFAATVRSECRFGATMAGWDLSRADAAVDRVLEEVGLTMVAAEHPSDLSLPIRRLVALASILVTDPMLLLLDEPTAGLDRDSRTRVIDVVRKRAHRGRATIAVTHDHVFAHEALDRAFVVDGGTIHDVGSTRSVLDGKQLPVPAALAVARAHGLEPGNDRHQDVAKSIAARLGR